MVAMSIFNSVFDEDIFAPLFPRAGWGKEEDELMKRVQNLKIRDPLMDYRETEKDETIGDELGNIDMSKLVTIGKQFGGGKLPFSVEDYASRPSLYNWTEYALKDQPARGTLVLGPRRYFPSYDRGK